MPWGTILFATLLLGLSLALLAIHWNTWQKTDHGGLPQRDRLFHRRQFRRRIQASGLLGVVGLVLLCGLWIEDAWAELSMLIGVALALGGVILLVLSDWWSTRIHYGREEVINAVEIELLKAEIRKFEEEKRKGDRGG